mmetsp:Transcript_11476/g.15643  ORF Transcript_11476/g.15643 Transcript_11476/m.15643 type:complete len:184 (+) Transcript_11476:113-664(+)
MTDYSSDMANKQNYPQAQPVVSNQQSYPPPVAPDFTQTYITATYTDYSQPPVSQAYGTGYPAAYPIQTQGEGYPQQAYTYPAGSVHQTHHQATTTAPVPVMMTYAMLDEGPTMVSCPHCQRTGMTNVSYTPSFAAIAICVLCTVCCGIPLCCVLCPCCGTCLHDKQHYCSNCNAFIGTCRAGQ